MSKLSDLKVNLRLSVYNSNAESKSVFGKGIADLCKGVRETGSLNAAAKRMGMAYSKAWRIIKETENALGIDLLIRDGAHGSTLTEDADRLLDAYYSITDELLKEAAELYKEKTE